MAALVLVTGNATVLESRLRAADPQFVERWETTAAAAMLPETNPRVRPAVGKGKESVRPQAQGWWCWWCRGTHRVAIVLLVLLMTLPMLTGLR